jgi:hypothetical protein
MAGRYGRLDHSCSRSSPNATISLHRDRDQPAVQRMGHRLPRPRLAAAIIDRVTFNATIRETSTSPAGSAPAKPQPEPGNPPEPGAKIRANHWGQIT